LAFVDVRGTLASEGDSRTRVKAKAQINAGGYFIAIGASVIMGMTLGSNLRGGLSVQTVWIMLGSTGITFVITYTWLAWNRMKLIDILATALRASES
jgi:hypothetical protein